MVSAWLVSHSHRKYLYFVKPGCHPSSRAIVLKSPRICHHGWERSYYILFETSFRFAYFGPWGKFLSNCVIKGNVSVCNERSAKWATFKSVILNWALSFQNWVNHNFKFCSWTDRVYTISIRNCWGCENLFFWMSIPARTTTKFFQDNVSLTLTTHILKRHYYVPRSLTSPVKI